MESANRIKEEDEGSDDSSMTSSGSDVSENSGEDILSNSED